MVRVFDAEFPENLYYHKDHMWVKVEEGKARVGYNDWAQKAAGKLVAIRTRRVGSTVKMGKTLGTVESGKWVGPLRAPISGRILELNEEALRNPSLINEDPYGRGWIAVIEPLNLEEELPTLMKGSDKEALEAWLREEKEKYGL